MPDRAHPAKHNAILWHHVGSTQRRERVELVNHKSQAESATASLKIIVESVEAIVSETGRDRDPAVNLNHFLDQLSLPEVKAIYVISQAGRNPSWLEETSSTGPLYLNLTEIRPANEGKQGFINFILTNTHNLRNYIDRYLETCSRLSLDPFEEIGILIQNGMAQEH
jgi:hypothetical protein